jgi:predicted short-subunit dehydrogenase-like oxidoreductase (DUF2520 family)
MKYNIVILGAGQMGFHLVRAFASAGHNVSVWSRHHLHAVESAENTGATVLSQLSEISADTDCCIAALSEHAISEVCPLLPPFQGILTHTAGSVPMDFLKPFAKRYGVFYPLQTFTKKRIPVYSEIPVFIEASDSKGLSMLSTLATSVFGASQVLDSEQRSRLHLAAVFACNFTNASLMAAQEITEQNGLDFGHLLPLIQETMLKTMVQKPSYNQTGPAVRNNKQIIEQQMNLLNDNPSLKSVYEAITQYIIEKNQHE